MGERADALKVFVERVTAAVSGRPDEARRLIDLAEAVLSQGGRLQALDLCRQALDDASVSNDGEVEVRARRILRRLIPGYHLPMMNDALRNARWAEVLSRTVRPDTTVLEIGTGAGMLALMAARAGARVLTCEVDPVLAEVAQEVIAANGYSDRIQVIGKDVRQLRVGVDLETRADLLFCDIFAETLVGFDPFPLIAYAQHELLTPTARIIPQQIVASAALAFWDRIAGYGVSAAGFDIGPMQKFTPESMAIPDGAAAPSLFSPAYELFRHDLSAAAPGSTWGTSATMRSNCDGIVNGVLQWIRLELDEATALDSCPVDRVDTFSGVRFHPFTHPRPVTAGDTILVRAECERDRLHLWLES